MSSKKAKNKQTNTDPEQDGKIKRRLMEKQIRKALTLQRGISHFSAERLNSLTNSLSEKICKSKSIKIYFIPPKKK